VVVKIVVAFDQNYLLTKCVNHDETSPGARRLPEGTFVICGSKSPFGPSAYLFASVTGMPARISSAFSLRYPA
ncbi:hypothetical protein, partial [Desulfosporosinus sp. I2]|uniref:hypothetical protein n=1 Tax=Desulfosporosinus sp. I2 TaxID=1617025 RepID=UPI0005F053FD